MRRFFGLKKGISVRLDEITNRSFTVVIDYI
jgi:hypothetical protein